MGKMSLVMPIFEYACPTCRMIFQYLSKRLKPIRKPTCPQCGNRRMVREISQFAALKGAAKTKADGRVAEDGLPDIDHPRMQHAMREMERDMVHLDENNPKHMAHMMRKMKDLMPADLLPKEMNDAIGRLESGEDPEKIEEDMGEIFDQFTGRDADGARGGGEYTRDGGLYDM